MATDDGQPRNKNLTCVLRAFEERSKVESVPQLFIDPGLLNIDTIKNDLKRERLFEINRICYGGEHYNYSIRTEALEWLARVANCDKISIETYALTIRLFDIGMQTFVKDMKINMVQLLCATCLTVASKLLDTHYLTNAQLEHYGGGAFTEMHLHKMELTLTQALTFSPYEILGTTPPDIIVPLAYLVTERESFSKIRTKANLFYCLLAHTPVFHGKRSSLVAGALVYRAHVSTFGASISESVLERIISIIEVDRASFESFIDSIEQAYITWMERHRRYDGMTVNLPVCHIESAEATPTDCLSASAIIDLLQRRQFPT